MALDPDARRRHARHLLLAEVGEAGQERLCAARVAASGIAAEYLARAGLEIDDAAEPLAIEPIRAGRPELEVAAAFVAAAFAATEHIKRVVGAGTPARWPADRALVGAA